MEVDTGTVATCTPELYDIASTLVNVEEVTNNKAFTDFKLSKPGADVIPLVTEKVVFDSDPKTSQNPENTIAETPHLTAVNNNVGKYRLLRTIGKGNFAKVKLAIHIATGVEVAIKIINKTVMDSTLLKRLKREITIMKMTNHPNIVKLLEIIENEDVLCLVMEYASGGEIFDYLVANGKMCEKKARVKFRQLLSAMQYCHAKRIVHRDLKAENILLDKNLNVKVADFGLANTFECDQRLTTFCGSPPYAAPELFLGIPYYGPSVDIWSLGVILFTLVLGHLPFDARDLRELRSKILGLHYSIPRGAVSPECDTLLRKMLILDPKDRSSLKSLMLDKWVNMGYAPDDHLRPYRELPKSQLDDSRLKAMEKMGFTRTDLESSVVNPAFDHVYATYHLLPETPSQFVELCKDLPSGTVALPHTMLPNSILTNNHETKSIHNYSAGSAELPSSTKSTAIGRFTVAPSGKFNESTSHSSSGRNTRSSLTSESNQATGNQKNACGFEFGNREHHSLTSALPVTLRRAIMQVGRNLTGGGTSTTSTEEGNSRATAQIVTGRHNKPVPKSCGGGRDVITAAPVPIGAVKKHGFGVSQQQPQKRQLSNQQSAAHSQNPPVRSKSPAIRNNSSPSNASTMSSESHGVTPKTNKESSAVMKINPDMTHRSSLNSTSRDNDKGSLQVAQKRNILDTNGAGLTSSSNTSSDSCAENEFRETASTNVQGVCKSVNISSHHHSTPQSVLEAKQEFQENGDYSCLTVPGKNNGHSYLEQSDLRSEKSEISRSLTNINQTNQMTNVTWLNDSGKTANVPSLNTHIKVLHTVQGTEALALRQEALRLQSAHSETKTPSNPHAAANIVVDSSHQSSWSRGVLKALGGFFVQSKSTEGRSDNQSSRLLNKPREVKFPWSMYTTSTKSAEELLKSIIYTLEVTPGCRYSHDPHLPFLLQCSWAADRPAIKTSDSEAINKDSTKSSLSTSLEVPSHGGLLRGDPVHWEMEVCQLPRVHLRGVRLKRIRGSTLHFRPIADLIMKSLRL
ncbi:Serine/threonine-protein kinase MARK2 [Schistosoma japonicum]|uniref:non-specific serine/threonine protein kinase n=4 Tax=Schistosoma japonicum TaxID=6182 RepID=A0A4Z2DTD0_SCHJA|nr:Serine/threonine-protein kinase MARK1 [Schistosoma japonicum]TNN19814.1 Serine/threonine-protein kinase MARK2 [Schistosoma japonicum]TNN19815.1 Serine/threonine-protein kinase MARK2 [Schistosoma japonicum]